MALAHFRIGELTISTKRYVAMYTLFTMAHLTRGHMISMMLQTNQLRTCVNAARQLGSSVAILASVFQLRDRLAQISFLFRENAADLYPRKVLRLPRESLVGRSKFPRRRLARRHDPLARGRRRLEFDKLDLEDFPQQLELFASDLSTFLYSLNEFPEFTDKAVDAPIIEFEDDLKVGPCATLHNYEC